MPPPENGFRQIGEREKVSGSFISLVTGTFVGPDGYTFERDMVRHKGAVAVVPLEEDGDTVRLVRQYRAPLDRAILELPAGKLDVEGEAEEPAARRELAEEVGVEAASMLELGRFYNSPGFTDELTVCFLAEGLREVGRSLQGIEEEHMTIEPARLSQLWSLVASGEIVDAKTVIGLALAQEALLARGEAGTAGPAGG